jgi:hypothetical protein
MGWLGARKGFAYGLDAGVNTMSGAWHHASIGKVIHAPRHRTKAGEGPFSAIMEPYVAALLTTLVLLRASQLVAVRCDSRRDGMRQAPTVASVPMIVVYRLYGRAGRLLHGRWRMLVIASQGDPPREPTRRLVPIHTVWQSITTTPRRSLPSALAMHESICCAWLGCGFGFLPLLPGSRSPALSSPNNPDSTGVSPRAKLLKQLLQRIAGYRLARWRAGLREQFGHTGAST